MAQDLVLNEFLKRIWAVDEKIVNGETITSEEVEFYNQNLPVIQKYYADKNSYWKNKTPHV